MMINERLAIAKKVETETDARRLRRWCVALLQDHAEMTRTLASKGINLERDATGATEPET